jgi:hypothetical protein
MKYARIGSNIVLHTAIATLVGVPISRSISLIPIVRRKGWVAGVELTVAECDLAEGGSSFLLIAEPLCNDVARLAVLLGEVLCGAAE